MNQLSTFYRDGCLQRKCDGCEYGPWVTHEVSENGVEYGGCNLWNVVQQAPWPQNSTGGGRENSNQQAKGE